MREPLFIYESSNGKVQRAIMLDKLAELELLMSGYRHIATIDPLLYLMFNINENLHKVKV